VWDAIGRHEVLTVKKHGSPISSVAFSPDGQRIITGGGSLVFSPDGVEQIHPGRGDGTVKVWELSDDKEVLTLKGHTNRVFTAAFSPDGHRVVTGSLDRTARIWEVESGRELEVLRGHSGGIRSVAYSRMASVLSRAVGIRRPWCGMRRTVSHWSPSVSIAT